MAPDVTTNTGGRKRGCIDEITSVHKIQQCGTKISAALPRQCGADRSNFTGHEFISIPDFEGLMAFNGLKSFIVDLDEKYEDIFKGIHKGLTFKVIQVAKKGGGDKKCYLKKLSCRDQRRNASTFQETRFEGFSGPCLESNCGSISPSI